MIIDLDGPQDVKPVSKLERKPVVIDLEGLQDVKSAIKSEHQHVGPTAKRVAKTAS